MNLYSSPLTAQQPDEEVKKLQQKMLDAGIAVKVDGIYGPKTDAAAVQYAQLMKQPVTPGNNNDMLIPSIPAGQIPTRTFNDSGNLREPYVSAPGVVAPIPAVAPKPEIDPNSYLGGLLANNAPKPTYNQKSEDQLRNMAKAQKIGEFLGLLGDVYGVSKGAPIQRRESQSAAPYMQSILFRQDKYKEQLDQFQKEQYIKKLQIGQAYDANKAGTEATAWRQQQFDAQQEYKKYLLATKQADSVESKRRFDAQQAQKDQDQRIAQERADKTGSSATDKAHQPVRIQTAKQVYELKPEEASFMRGEAINSPEVHALHPEWFVPVTGKRGKITYKVDPEVKPEDLTRAWIEVNREGLSSPTQKVGSPAYLDKYRTEKGIPLSGEPILQPSSIPIQPVNSNTPSLFQ